MQTRESEIARYVECYKDPRYKMGDKRRAHVEWALKRGAGGSLLDVSTGRGEVIHLAVKLGYHPVMGTEAVPNLCGPDYMVQAMAHDLPFGDDAFETVTMFDVMEHLLPSDTEAVCKELERVASRRVILTVCNAPSSFGGADKGDLHINRRDSYEAWHSELKQHFSGSVARLPRMGSISEMFEVTW
jgi:hypothetical protein